MSFYEDMKEVMVTINQSIVKARNFAERFDERYIIAYENNDLAIRYLSKIVKSFMEVFPNVQVELKMVDFQRKNTVFLEDKADFLFTVRDSIIKIPQTDYRELYIGRFMCILSEKHELSGKKSLSFETLNGETLVLLNPSLCPEEMKRMEEQIIEACPDSPVLYVDNQLSGCTLASCELGIAIMPDFIYHATATLCMIPLQTSEVISYGAVWHTQDRRKQTCCLLEVAERIFRAGFRSQLDGLQST